MATFEERIKMLRLEHGLSQEELGELIGVKRFSIYSYEKGRACPEMKGLIGLADYFKVSIDYLVGRTDNPEVNRAPYPPPEDEESQKPPSRAGS